MNGARSTYMRKGYLLTALAAAVLLAASSGTAYAQGNASFNRTNITVEEGASSSDMTGAPQIVDIMISGLTITEEAPTNTMGIGGLTIVHALDATNTAPGNRRLWLILEGSTALNEASHPDSGEQGTPADTAMDGKIGLENGTTTLSYDKNGVIRLAIIDPGRDSNWKDDQFNIDIRLTSPPSGASSGPAAMVTIDDNDVAPVVKFTPAHVKLTERSNTTTTVTVASGNDKDAPAALSDITGQLRLMVSNPKIVWTGPDADAEDAGCAVDGVVLAISGDGVGTTDEMGEMAGSFELQVTGGLGGTAMTTTGADLTLEACDETMDFRHSMISLTPTAASLMGGATGPGDIGAGAGLAVEVESNEEVPVVEFSTDEQPVDEGDATSVFLVASTMQGDEVGMADVMVTGDARDLPVWRQCRGGGRRRLHGFIWRKRQYAAAYPCRRRRDAGRR